MKTLDLVQQLREARERAGNGDSREILDRFARALEELLGNLQSDRCPPKTQNKIAHFLSHVEASAETLGSKLCVPAFALNVTGEAMVRSDLIHRSVVEFLQVGLYFYGLQQIERRWPAQAMVYSGIHGEELTRFLSRKSLKGMLESGTERLESGRHFCLTYTYLNGLRRAYWSHCRASEDALDVAMSGDLAIVGAAGAQDAPDPDEPLAPEDRVGVLLKLFQSDLTDRQRWIYVAKSRSRLYEAESDQLTTLEAFLGAETMGQRHHDLTWTEISSRLGINEKTAKREYIKTLHVLLKGAAEAVLGDRGPSRGYVRRVLTLLRDIAAEKDLRIKSNAGRGMGVVVEKWEVALRYILNHSDVHVA